MYRDTLILLRAVRWLLGLLVALDGAGCSLLVSGQDDAGNDAGSDAGSDASSQPACPTKMSAAGWGGCLVNGDGELYCWGLALTSGTGTALDQLVPARVELDDVRDVHMSEAHACAIHGEEGHVSCWGRNENGQLGDGSAVSQFTPVRVQNIDGAVAIRTGEFHTCAQTSDDALWCWGDNAFGELGDGTQFDRDSPTRVEAVNGVNMVDVQVGDFATCALGDDERVYCWGYNGVGLLGDNGVEPERHRPGLVGSLDSVASLSLGCGGHACAMRFGAVWCWGRNESGQAVPSGMGLIPQPELLAGIDESALQRVKAGGYHSCAFQDMSNTVFCWGRNDHGAAGSATGDPLPPTAVEGIPVEPIRQIETGCEQACVLLANGEIYCWGANAFGQLGNGLIAEASPTPTRVQYPSPCREVTSR